MSSLELVKSRSDERVFALFSSLAGPKVEAAAHLALQLSEDFELKIERAMADSLEQLKLNKRKVVKNEQSSN